MAKQKTVTINAPKEEIKEIVPIGAEYTIEVEGKKGYLCKIDKKTFKTVFPLISPFDGSKPDFITAGEIILAECWIGGDMDIRTDEALSIAASIQCIALIELKNASLKKN
jgi:hypothetical protein